MCEFAQFHLHGIADNKSPGNCGSSHVSDSSVSQCEIPLIPSQSRPRWHYPHRGHHIPIHPCTIRTLGSPKVTIIYFLWTFFFCFALIWNPQQDSPHTCDTEGAVRGATTFVVVFCHSAVHKAIKSIKLILILITHCICMPCRNPRPFKMQRAIN